MKARDCSACDGDKEKRKELAGNHRTTTMNIGRECRKLQLRMNQQHSRNERRKRAELDVGGKIIARLEQQPYRQHGRQKSIGAEQQNDLVSVKEQQMRERRV